MLCNLRLIVELIVVVYMPIWFNVIAKHSWVEGPRHVLYQLELLRSQKKVLDLVMTTVRSAWYGMLILRLCFRPCCAVRKKSSGRRQ